ncbi:DUF6861 domain-containing protein [Pseudomonas sp. NFR16]|uniref:DUF6861 domain-containing protein n=1 Tax=Pseudomonas sp. NFR16 TaxID=1566248 RepID=UPI0008CE4F0E|nr:hypothetical protein [Pseudomonas sp. NFR16]SEI46890.1 hypothetical protein SAMN03159495_0402 [Pseudomonas sp. NFR16]
MDLLAHVPSWDDIERNLDHKFSELNQSVSHGLQSAHDGWDGFTRRVSNGASQAYGAMGGHRIDYVRQAMALSYPIVQSDLTRKWASINITEILPVLLKLVQDVVMILGGSVAVGGAVGGAVGSLAFGAGALPGAVAGGSIGLQVGNLILATLGLWSITGYFAAGLQPCAETLWDGLTTAWHAEEGLKPPGLDPTGASAATILERTQRAARQLARGQEQLVLLLLTAIVTYLTRGQLRTGVTGALDSIATRSAKLQAEISNRKFADWLARNERAILDEPDLQMKEVGPWKEPDPQLLAMREYYAKQDPVFVPVEKQISRFSTFETIGVQNAEIDAYLATAEGRSYLNQAAAADPSKPFKTIYDRVRVQLASGKELPVAKTINSPLIKIVVEGGPEPSFSPYFTSLEEFKRAASSRTTLADAFGLPLNSEGVKYTIYKITPLEPSKVYISEVAQTSELGGAILRTGGAKQFLIPNRGLWAPAEKIGTIGN